MERWSVLAIWSRLALCVSLALALLAVGLNAHADEPAGPPLEVSPPAPTGLAWTESAWDLEVLRGIGAIHVVVLPVSPDGASAGITQGMLRADVEHRLRREGITVIVDADLTAARISPEREIAALRVAFDDLRRDSDPDGYHEFWLSFELWQEAQLAHRSMVHSPVTTWTRHATGTHRTYALAGALKDAMRESLDNFVADWRTVHGGREARALPLVADSQAAAGDGEPEGD